MNLTRKIDALRDYRNSLRRQLRDAQRLVDPTSRRVAADQLRLQLAMTNSEWAQLHHQAGRTLPGKPVKVG